VIRAGAGTFYARLIGGLLNDLYTGNGIYQISDSLSSSNSSLLAAGPVFPNALTAPVTGITAGASTLDVLSPKLKTPYSEQATIAVERQLAKDMVLTVSASSAGAWICTVPRTPMRPPWALLSPIRSTMRMEIRSARTLPRSI